MYVRRLFDTIEDTVSRGLAWVVFERSEADTWLRVETMVTSYLIGLWPAGALLGSKPEHALFVRCGLGTTMTALDIREGRVVVELGIAAVRPAEVVIIRQMRKVRLPWTSFRP